MATAKQLAALKKARAAKAKKAGAKPTEKKAKAKASLKGTDRKWVETGHSRFEDYILVKGDKAIKTYSTLSAAKKHGEKLKGDKISITQKITHNFLKLV